MRNTSISFLKNHFNDFNFFGLQCRKYTDMIFDVISVIWRDFKKIKMLLYFRGKILMLHMSINSCKPLL